LQQIGCNLRPRKPRFRNFAILLAQPDQVASPEEFSEWLFAADNFKGVSVIFSSEPPSYLLVQFRPDPGPRPFDRLRLRSEIRDLRALSRLSIQTAMH
jgi:hypothetical protein